MKNVYEIFDELAEAKNDHDRKAILYYNRSYALESVLQGIFGPVEFNVTEIPKYKRSDSPPGLGYSNLSSELHRAYLFVKGHPKTPAGLTEQRKNLILVQILESLEAKEADVFIAMLQKKNPVKGLTKELVKEVFPHLY